MTDEEMLIDFLSKQEISTSGRIVRNQSGEQRYFVFVNVHRDSDNKQVPSNRKLDGIRESLKIIGVSIEFVLTDDAQQDIEGGARASLIRSFGSMIRNAFLSVEKSSTNIWLDAKRDLTDVEMREIRDRLSIYLDNFGLRISNVYSTKQENVPTKFAVLRALRKISPANIESLSNSIVDRGFVVPSMDFLARRLDSLRKSGLIVRLKSGRYVLTSEGLGSLGTAKNRRSPDVERLLDLARRGR